MTRLCSVRNGENDLATETGVVYEEVFGRMKFDMRLGRIHSQICDENSPAILAVICVRVQ